jgi:hypothetical protein
MNTYIKPEIKIQNVVVEQLLASESGGQGAEWDAKRNDFWTSDEDEADELSINDVWE